MRLISPLCMILHNGEDCQRLDVVTRPHPLDEASKVKIINSFYPAYQYQSIHRPAWHCHQCPGIWQIQAFGSGTERFAKMDGHGPPGLRRGLNLILSVFGLVQLTGFFKSSVGTP